MKRRTAAELPKQETFAWPLAVCGADGRFADAASALAAHLGCPLLTSEADEARARLLLRYDESGLSLLGGGQSIRGDFSSLLARIKAGNLGGEMIVRACRLKNQPRALSLLDATAGMGEDSFLLAAAGFRVQLFERDPVIAALLRDALDRAGMDPLLSAVAARMTLTEGDSIAGMKSLAVPPDVILLDPMFPERQKTSLVKKKFQVIHQLEEPCADEAALLEAAVGAKPKRIVIKRPGKGPFLAGRKPSYSVDGKSIRYDCIVLPENETKSGE